MSDKMIALYTEFTARLHAMAAHRDERGQGTLEYVGIAIVAAILVVAVVGAVTDADIGGAVGEQIDKVLDAG